MAAGSLGKAFVQVYADTSRFSPGLKQKIKAALDENTKNIDMPELDKSMERAGESAGEHVAQGVGKTAPPAMEKEGRKSGNAFSKGLSTMVGALGSLLMPALIAFGVQAAAALVPAAIALGGTLPAAIFSLIGVMATLKMATNGVGDALKFAFDPAKSKQFEEAMKKLAPAAQSFVREIQALRPAFHDLQQDVQQTFFTQLQGVLTRVSGQLLPTLRTGFRNLAADIGRMGATVLNAFGSNRGNIAAIFHSAHEALMPLIPAVGKLVTAFLQIAGAAGPMFQALSGGFARLLTDFSDFIAGAAESGALTNFFGEMLVVLRQFAGLLGSVFDLLVTVIGSLQATGGQALGILGSLITALDTFLNTDAGQTMLIAVFTLLNTVLGSLMSIVTPLLPVIAELVTAIAGGLTDAITTLTPYLQDAAEWLGKHPDLLKAAAAAWGIYKVALMAVAFYEGIVAAMNPVTWIVLAIAAIAAGAYLIYKNWSVVEDALKSAWGAISDFFSGIWQWIQGVGTSIGNWFTVTLPNFFAAIPGAIWAALSALPGMLWNLFLGALNLAGQAIGTGIGLLIAAIVVLPGLIWDGIKSIGQMFVDLWNLTFALGRAIVEAGIAAIVWYFTVLPGRIWSFLMRLPGIIGGAFKTAWDWAKREVREGAEAIVSYVMRLPGRISGFMRNVGHDILSGLKSGINSVISGFNSGINRVGNAIHIGLPNIPLLASGGLITSPTLAVVGEAGKEAVIPMSDPARAAAVAKSTGLLDMLGSRAGHAEALNVKVYLGTQEITDILDARVDRKLNDQANELAYGTR